MCGALVATGTVAQDDPDPGLLLCLTELIGTSAAMLLCAYDIPGPARATIFVGACVFWFCVGFLCPHATPAWPVTVGALCGGWASALTCQEDDTGA